MCQETSIPWEFRRGPPYVCCSSTSDRGPITSLPPACASVPIGLSGSVESTTAPCWTHSFSGSVTSQSTGGTVEPEQERAVVLLLAARAGLADRVAGDEHADHVQERVVPVVAVHLAAGGVDPGQVLGAADHRRPALEPVPLAQRRVLTTDPERGARDLVDVQPGVVRAPVHPRDLVVLDVGVVVAALGAAPLVAGGQHRDAVGQAQGRDQVGGLPAAQREDRRVVGLALLATVPGPVVVGAVTVALAVGLVVLAVVRHQVAQREPVVGGHEVDRVVRRAPVVGVQVRGAGQPRGERADPVRWSTPARSRGRCRGTGRSTRPTGVGTRPPGSRRGRRPTARRPASRAAGPGPGRWWSAARRSCPPRGRCA